MVSLDRFDTFKAIVDAGSLTAAASLLGQSKAVVSFNLKRLEQELGVTLLVRNTRSLALTEAGERFYQHCSSLLAAAQVAIDDARSEQSQLRGTLRLTTTPEYAVARVVPLLESFRALHPQLRIHLATSPAPADLIPERFDLAIRLGRLQDSQLRATLLDEHALCAVVTLDSASTLRAFALAGAGAAVLPRWLIEADLEQGRLQPILRRHRFPRQGVYAVFPGSAHPSPKVRLLLDHLRQHLPARG